MRIDRWKELNSEEHCERALEAFRRLGLRAEIDGGARWFSTIVIGEGKNRVRIKGNSLLELFILEPKTVEKTRLKGSVGGIEVNQLFDTFDEAYTKKGKLESVDDAKLDLSKENVEVEE